MSTINTSRAATINIDLFDIDDIPLSLAYTNKQTNEAIDITDYSFTFRLMDGNTKVAEYSIAAGVVTSDYLSKNANIINTKAMWEDIQAKVSPKNYRMMQIVIDSEGNKFVHIIYNINARKY